MHSSTLFLVALASIMVSFTSARALNNGNSVAGASQMSDNQGAHVNLNQKRRMRKRLSPGNSGSLNSGSNTGSVSRASTSSGGPLDAVTGLLGGSGSPVNGLL